MDYKKKVITLLNSQELSNEQKEKLESIFPELKESEDDRIKKVLIDYFKWYKEYGIKTFYDIPSDDVLAWVEKQGEHANFRNSIQVGDKVTRNVDGVLVNLSQLNRVAKKDERQGEKKPNPVLDIDIPFGAKDSELQEASYYIPEGFHAEIESNRVVIKRGEQKPAEWSEEDERMFNSALWHVKNSCGNQGKNSGEFEVYNWLKSLKDRVQPQKQEWSEDDECKIDKIVKVLDYVSNNNNLVIGQIELEDLKNWLKSLRPQKQWKPSDEQMHYLSWVANIKLGDSVVEQEVSKHLNELLEDLKKLREE